MVGDYSDWGVAGNPESGRGHGLTRGLRRRPAGVFTS